MTNYALRVDYTQSHSLVSCRMKYYICMVTNDGNVPQESFYILDISKSTWCSLASNGLASILIGWVELIN